MRPPPTGLPIEAAVPELRDALVGRRLRGARRPTRHRQDDRSCRCASPTSRGSPAGRIVVLEPRRLATRAAARRMAALLGEEVGATVGYTTRDDRKVSAATRVEVVTEGVLTRRLQRDPQLPGVGLVVFDEVHERNLQTDLGLALALDVRSELRPDLRLLAMSATVAAPRLAALLGGDAEAAPSVVTRGLGAPRRRPVAAAPPARSPRAGRRRRRARRPPRGRGRRARVPARAPARSSASATCSGPSSAAPRPHSRSMSCRCTARWGRPTRMPRWRRALPGAAGSCWPPTSPSRASRSRACGSSSTAGWPGCHGSTPAPA